MITRLLVAMLALAISVTAYADDENTTYYLNVDLSTSWPGAVVSIDNQCMTPWTRYFGNPYAANDIVAFQTTTAAPQFGGWCIPFRSVYGNGQVTVTLNYQECPYGITSPTGSLKLNHPGQRAVIGGCDSRIASPQSTPPVDVRWGGIAFDFEDSFWIGKQYALGSFMGVFEGNGQVNNTFENPMREVVNHSVFRYTIMIQNPIVRQGYN